jgi:hypothetical protein
VELPTGAGDVTADLDEEDDDDEEENGASVHLSPQAIADMRAGKPAAVAAGKALVADMQRRGETVRVVRTRGDSAPPDEPSDDADETPASPRRGRRRRASPSEPRQLSPLALSRRNAIAELMESESQPAPLRGLGVAMCLQFSHFIRSANPTGAAFDLRTPAATPRADADADAEPEDAIAAGGDVGIDDNGVYFVVQVGQPLSENVVRTFDRIEAAAAHRADVEGQRRSLYRLMNAQMIHLSQIL